MSAIASNLQDVLHRIEAATTASGRPAGSVGLIAVSKTFPVEAIAQARDFGQRAFGENYVQEGLGKIAFFHDCQNMSDARANALEWHLIGPIQSNKTRLIAEHFDWVHGVDRLRIAERLSEQRPAHLGPLNLCIQVNIDGEASKSGVAPEQLPDLARAVEGLSGVRLRGLMAIPAAHRDPARQRIAFAKLRTLLEQLQHFGHGCDQLSMGMSADFEAAIVEGATLVRIGTAIFGTRDGH